MCPPRRDARTNARKTTISDTLPDLTEPRAPAPGRSVRPKDPERKAWLVAWLLALLLHVVAIIGLGRITPARSFAASPQAPETVQVSLQDPARLYTELPKDRTDEAPQHADLLANVMSRARDRVPGGDAAMPRLRGEGDLPAVKLQRDHSQERTAAAATSAPPPTAQPAGLQPARFALPGESHDPSASAAPGPARAAGGGAAVTQQEMESPDGNAGLMGDVSLNTTAWDYAPWLDRYRTRLLEHWYAPPAYAYGVLKEGGWAIIEVEIARSGQVLRQDLLGQEGHPTLIRAAEAAVRATAPTEALPANFPEPTLVLRIRMIYPRVHPR